MTNKLAIVVPCYNEQEVFQETSKQLTQFLKEMIKKNHISDDSFILFVDDGSKDNTWQLIENEYENNKYISGLKLAGNVGHQNALLSGLMAVKDEIDISVSIDADLQDDISVIENMILEYQNGYDIVYGVRKCRKTDTFFKRTTALGFYKVMEFMGVKSVNNHADFRLMSQRSLDYLSQFKERNLFLRGIVPLIGYETTSVYYDRSERFAGESKYPLKKMISFAFDGITSFSIKPITFIMVLGLIIIFFSMIAITYTLIAYLFNKTTPGWSSLMISIWFFGGIQLFSIGLVGQYIGKVYIEAKERPRYNIEKVLKSTH